MRPAVATLCAAVLAILALGAWFFVSTSDDAFRAAQEFFGDAKVIESGFQNYFYGRADYPRTR